MSLREKQLQYFIRSTGETQLYIIELISNMNNPKRYLKDQVLASLSRAHFKLGLKAYFVDQNILALKQHFHVGTKLALAAIAEKKGFQLDTSNLILYALLSDSPEIIKAVAIAESSNLKSGKNVPQYNHFWVHMYQLAILDRFDEIQDSLDKAATQTKKKIRDEIVVGKDFFSLFLAMDKVGLEELLLTKAKNIKFESDSYLENLIAREALLETKLCWLKGIDVEIDHPLIPMELLPIKPLTHYDDVYDFLDPNWQPPPQGFIDKVANFFKR